MSLFETNPPVARGPAPTQFQTLTIVAIVLVVVSAIWGFVDTRMVEGALVWMKPMKFALSFVVLFGTIALVEARLSQPVRDGWPLRIIGWIMAAAFLSEMAYIMYQGARVEGSHFNRSTPFHRFMYDAVMAAGAVSLVVCVAAIGWLAKRDRDADLGAGLRAGIWLGFLASFVLTMIVAGYLSFVGGHHVGLHPEGAPTLPLVGWSGVTGDLRPAHFLSLHAMQFLPLVGLWVDRRGTETALRSVRLAAATYAALTLAVFALALQGLPLIPLG